ncbi:hypothetical protein RB653_009502 [Dictyostelium firmibasis]|uniref:Uncharacterized protein n=1 Tax=Dictyostelium firmibasis TaxID=79012 RepID=A0AAN7Z0P8_9MYCE
MENKRKKNLKVIMLGNLNSGKTAIFNEFAGRRFGTYTCPSTFDMFYKEMKIGNEIATLNFWDTAGQEKFKSLNRHYYRFSICCILCFDIHNEESFNSLDKWINELHEKGLENGLNPEKTIPLIVLLGTKSDITKSDKSISKERVENWCKGIEDRYKGDKINYFETSSKYSINIKESLNLISNLALNQYNLREIDEKKLKVIPLKQSNLDSYSSTC